MKTTEITSKVNLPTAKDYISKNLTDFWEGGEAQYREEDVEKAMIEFAKMHTEAALNQAKEIEEERIKKEREEAYKNGYANGQMDAFTN